MHICDLKMSFSSRYKFSECFCSWIIKCCSDFNHSDSEFLTSNNVISPPTLSFPVKTHFIFQTNLKTRADTINNFFKLLKRLQPIIFPILDSFDFVIDKALTVNLVFNSSIRTSGGTSWYYFKYGLLFIRWFCKFRTMKPLLW